MYQISGCFNLLKCLCVVLALCLQMQAQSKPTLKGTDLVINGESFFAASNIASELTRLARADGVLPSNESFKQIAVSGAYISQILGYYKNCNPKPKYLLTDGGGNDLMPSCGGTPTAECTVIKNCSNTLQQYISEMKKGGTKKFLWMCYPDPQGARYVNLKANQDVWAVETKKMVLASENPKGLWFDMRTVWQGHYSQYTSDGIHCTSAGGTACAEAFWKVMKENNYAFFDTNTTSINNENTVRNTNFLPVVSSQLVGNGNVTVSLSVDKPSNIKMQLTTLSGRNVFSADRQTAICGPQTIMFPIGTLSNGIYLCKIQNGNLTNQSKLIIGR